MSLPILPNELITSIAIHLLPSLRDLNSWAQTSHLFHQVINPIIYQNHSQKTLQPALCWAAQRGKLAACIRLLCEDVVTALLSAKETDPNAPDEDLRTPLLFAAGKGMSHFDRGLFPKIPPDGDKFIAGHYLAVVKALLSVKGIQVDRPDNRGRTPLAVAAGSGAESTVEEILRTGKADPNSRDMSGQTPLMGAAMGGSPGIFNLLIGTEGVEVDAKSNVGDTALLAAAGVGNVEIMKVLLAMPNVDPTEVASFGGSALISTIYNGYTDAVALLLADERVDLNIVHQFGATPLVKAAQCGHTHIMQMLLERGAEPDESDSIGNTALRVSAEKGNIEAIQLLLSTGRCDADLDLTEGPGFPPFLSVSSYNMNEAVLKIFDDYKRRHRTDHATES
ncbi:unnamed protein product [Penicillium salamii]|uniref:F-box domain-containing protein n=1 Tax=Penicillium salamii TaxID=1612424 RepID=A0A9W4JZ52_9EURO|nr:unnamed protein product [Penicillium salamii]